jgi:hypothetical protein
LNDAVERVSAFLRWDSRRFGLPLGCGMQVSGWGKSRSREGKTNGEQQRRHRRRETEQRSQGP